MGRGRTQAPSVKAPSQSVLLWGFSLFKKHFESNLFSTFIWPGWVCSCGLSPDQGSNPGPLHWEQEVLVLGPPREVPLILFKLFILHWSIADQQCCDSSRWVAKELSFTYTWIYSPPNSLHNGDSLRAYAFTPASKTSPHLTSLFTQGSRVPLRHSASLQATLARNIFSCFV